MGRFSFLLSCLFYRENLSAIAAKAVLVEKVLERRFAAAGTRFLPRLDRHVRGSHLFRSPLSGCACMVRFYAFRKRRVNLFLPSRTMDEACENDTMNDDTGINFFITSRESTCEEKLGTLAWITLTRDGGALCHARANLDHLSYLLQPLPLPGIVAGQTSDSFLFETLSCFHPPIRWAIIPS